MAAIDDLLELKAERDRLRQLATVCYAGLGAECELPESWLDVFEAASEGEPFTTDGLLPYTRAQYRRATPEEERAVDDALELVRIEQRLPRELHARLVANAGQRGLALPAYIRALLELGTSMEGQLMEDQQAQLNIAIIDAIKWSAWARRAFWVGAALLVLGAGMLIAGAVKLAAGI